MDYSSLNENEMEQTVNLLKSITGERKAIYVSVPITTGPRFMDWYSRRGMSLDPLSDQYKREHYKNVIIPNCLDARDRISMLRKMYADTVVIDPTVVEHPKWSQEDYHFFWSKIVECCVCKVVFLDGWQYSAGCTHEFLVTVKNEIEARDEKGLALSRQTALDLISRAMQELTKMNLPLIYLERVISELGLVAKEATYRVSNNQRSKGDSRETLSYCDLKYKDAVLNQLADERNIAQFVSFGPGDQLQQRFARIIGVKPNNKFDSPKQAIVELLTKSDESSANIRTFNPEQPKGGEFFYGKSNPDEIVLILSHQAQKGMYTIVNETIDVKDGGVSGVALGKVIEFAPYETPKCVDEAGVCSLPVDIALHILENVYGFVPSINPEPDTRVEFSIHPRKRGLHKDHIIIWEVESIGKIDARAFVQWPNKFSQAIGDKVFGLLIADALMLPVPRTIVLCRSMASFTFGQVSEKLDTWIRTSPRVRTPGKYPSIKGWQDPFEFMNSIDLVCNSDDNKHAIASLLIQESIYPAYSGALITNENGQPVIEGLKGYGDHFMVGLAKPEKLPQEVLQAVRKQHRIAFERLGPVEMEWVYDGLTAWIVQLHKNIAGATNQQNIIVPGTPKLYHTFEVTRGLEALREMIRDINNSSDGVVLIGDVGMTSHFGDLLRNAKIPSRIERDMLK